MKLHTLTLLMVVLSGSAHGQFRELWRLGEDDGNANDFTQEIGGSAAEPGSPEDRDDDYYFAGTYPDPIGVLTVDEVTGDDDPSNTAPDPTGFERAVTHGNRNNRIHFNLSASEADASARYRFTLDLFGGGFWDGSGNGGWGTHDIEVLLNGNSIFSQTGITEETVVTVEDLDPVAVGAVAGANKVEIVRTGGVNGPNGTSNGWIQFDTIALEIDESAIACTDAICNFGSTAGSVNAGDSVTLNWLTSGDATVSIDNGVGSVAAGSGEVMVAPAESTTYTMTSMLGGETATAEVTIAVVHLFNFGSDVQEVSPTNPNVTLNWTVDPNSSVSIDQGIGNVDDQTFGGVGSVTVPVAADTTFTITVTTGDDVETQEVFVDFEYDDYSSLWQLGVNDNTPAEFNQELAGSFPAPGSADARDDDYYFAGIYPDTVGIVAEDETITDPVDQQNTSPDPKGMERAVTSGAPETRIHFVLDASQAVSTNEFRFQTFLMGGGWWNPDIGGSGGFGSHDVDILFNGVPIFSQTAIITPTPVREHFSAGSVNAVEGENVVEVVRVGGASNPADPGGNTGWIQFDYFSLESRGSTDPAIGFQISDISYDSETGMTSVTFPSSPGQTFKVETSTNLFDWTIFDESYPADSAEAETTVELSLGTKAFVQVTRN